MSRFEFVDPATFKTREATLVQADRCETCIRWKRYAGQASGRCGKKGWRTPAGDWCRYFTREAIDVDE